MKPRPYRPIRKILYIVYSPIQTPYHRLYMGPVLFGGSLPESGIHAGRIPASPETGGGGGAPISAPTLSNVIGLYKGAACVLPFSRDRYVRFSRGKNFPRKPGKGVSLNQSPEIWGIFQKFQKCESSFPGTLLYKSLRIDCRHTWECPIGINPEGIKTVSGIFQEYVERLLNECGFTKYGFRVLSAP